MSATKLDASNDGKDHIPRRKQRLVRRTVFMEAIQIAKDQENFTEPWEAQVVDSSNDFIE